MNLSNPDARRALRACVAAILTIALLAFVWWFAPRVTDPHDMLVLLGEALGIIGLFVFLYGIENVSRAITFKAGKDGVEASVGAEEGAGQ
jgi:hypothetical protein